MRNYTVEEAAGLIGIASVSLKNRIKDRKIQATEQRGKLVISEEALDKYIKYRELYPHGKANYTYEDEI